MSRFIYCYAECRYAECRNAEWRYAEFRCARWNKLERLSATCFYHDNLIFSTKVRAYTSPHLMGRLPASLANNRLCRGRSSLFFPTGTDDGKSFIRLSLGKEKMVSLLNWKSLNSRTGLHLESAQPGPVYRKFRPGANVINLFFLRCWRWSEIS